AGLHALRFWRAIAGPPGVRGLQYLL
ncbi:hypothetical protein CKQ90_17675, partial [Klebsiella pneumoniae]